MHPDRFATTPWLVALLALALAGCNSIPKRDPAFAASYPAAHAGPIPAQAATGSIYQAGYDRLLFEDLRARRVGDILTVRLTEATNSAKSAETTVDRSQSTTVTNPTIFGTTPQFDVPGLLPLANTQDNSLQTNLSSELAFDGESESDMSNSLTGSITVTVADVLPNGNLVVRGEKRLNLNQGNEYVKISGIVRPVDIATDNSVASTQVADATIVYNGDGATADGNRMGWLSRFFVSAVFPF